MSGLYDAAMEAHRALCTLEDFLDALHRAGGVAAPMTDSETDAVRLVASRWAVDTDRKVKRALSA